MSNIGSLGGLSSLAASIFSKIDSKNQGYISKSDLQSAYDSAISSTSDSSNSVDQLFSKLDSNGDSKITKDEFTSGLQNLASQLDTQFNNMRMGRMPPPNGNSGGMPPPPPPGEAGQAMNDTGHTKDELTAKAKEVASSDPNLANLMNSIASNFDKADTNGDGKVDLKESIAYLQSQQATSSSSSATTSSTPSDATTSSTSTSTSSASSGSQDQMLAQLMQLLRAYGINDSSTASNSIISAVA